MWGGPIAQLAMLGAILRLNRRFIILAMPSL
jgi:hypothetical protein